MSRNAWLRGGSLLALVALSLSLPGVQPTSYGGWPAIGFAAALYVLAGPARRLAVSGSLLVVVTVALTFSYDVSPPVAAAGSLAVWVPALFTGVLLTGDRAGGLRPGDVDGVRYYLVTLGSGLLCGVMSGPLVAVVLTPRDAVVAGVMSALAAVTAQLLVLPLFLPRSDRGPVATSGELLLQRVLLIVVTLAVFVPDTRLAIAFLVFPLLGWAAVRASRREAVFQVFAVGVTAYVFTASGFGPLAGSMRGLPGELIPALVYTFVAAASYLIVPLALGVEQLSAMTGEATRSALTLERLLDSVRSTVIIATDAQGRITHYNPAARKLLGYPPRQVLGRSPARFHTAEEIARHAAHFGIPADYTSVVLAMVEAGESRDWEFRHRNGSARVASLTVSAVAEPDGTVVGYIGAGEEVTERLRAEEALRAALDREQASVRRLEEVDHVKQELVSNVSHELRTPITSISGYAELLSDGTLGELGPRQVDAVRRIERNTSRLGLLVEDLLTLSRAQAGTLELEPAPIDLRDVVRDGHDVLDDLLRDRDLRVCVDLPATPVELLGDAPALERVVVNLLGNAIKFTPDGGQIDLVVRAVGPDAQLVVRDSGIGIPLEDQEHLFTRFFRSSAATSLAIPGTGLGLSIVLSIVEGHRGRVAVESAPGAGTAVTVLLPVQGPADEDETAQKTAQKTAPDPRTSPGAADENR